MSPTEVLSAEQLRDQARSAYLNLDYPAAGRFFAAAAEAFEARAELVQAAEMANNSSVAWLQAGDAESSLQAVLGTHTVFAQAGEVRLQAMAIGNQAAALEALGRLNEAVTLYEQSAVMLDDMGEGQLRAYILEELSKIQFRTGRQFEALATLHSGFEGIQKPSLKYRLLKRLLRIPLNMLGTKLKD